MWNAAAQDAALLERISRDTLAFAGDDKNEFSAVALRRAQKVPQRAKGRVLMHAVKIEDRIDASPTLREFCLQPPLDAGQSRKCRGFARGRRLRRLRNLHQSGLDGDLDPGDRRFFWKMRQAFTMPGRHAARDLDPKLYFFIG